MKSAVHGAAAAELPIGADCIGVCTCVGGKDSRSNPKSNGVVPLGTPSGLFAEKKRVAS